MALDGAGWGQGKEMQELKAIAENWISILDV